MKTNKVSISLVTTCKGRLKYLKESLPSWLALDYDNYDIIIVDYDDPDGTEEYIKKNKEKLLSNSKAKDIKVVKVKNKPFFNLNDARNRGINVSSSKLVFIIDSDIHIKQTNLLKRIDFLYKKGVVFFSSQLILNTNYKEIILLYRVYYDIELNFPLLLPLGTPVKGLNGTACFIKTICKEIGGFNPVINKQGYGQDENEFYLRYLNYYFKKYYIRQRKGIIYQKELDNALLHFYTFAVSSFKIVENSDEEKSQYYPQNINSSFEYNKKFVKEFIIKELQKYKGVFNSKKSLITAKTFELKKINKREIPGWFGIQIYYIFAKYLTQIGDNEKAIRLFKKLLKNRYLPVNYRLDSYIGLARMLFRLNNKDYKRYYKKAINLVDKNESKIKGCSNLIRANIYFKLNNYKLAKKYTDLVLSKNINPSDRAAAYFLKSILEPEKEREYKRLSIIERMKKGHLANGDIIKIAKTYYEIGEEENAEKWANKLLNNNTIPLKYRVSSLLILGDIYFKRNRAKAEYFYKQAIKSLDMIKDKKPIEIQRIASLYKRMGKFERSIPLFKKLIVITRDTLLKSNAYFHLGEIELELNHEKEAIQYFKKCLELNPEHRKAKEYSEELTKN